MGGKDSIEKVQEYSKSQPNGEAVGGWCEVDCGNNLKIFFLVMGVLSILMSTGRVGNALVALRCIDVRDKSLSLAFNVVFLSLIGMLPSPIIMGAIIDKTCTLWQMECGEQSNCILYDLDLMRKYVMSFTASIMIIGVLFDVAVWYYSKDVVLFSTDENSETEESKKNDTEADDTEHSKN